MRNFLFLIKKKKGENIFLHNKNIYIYLDGVAMYLVDHQMNNELSKLFGKIYARIPLREPATIVNADALTTDWESVVPKNKLSYILGNPPFIGASLMEKEQKENFLKLFDDTR